MRALDFDLDAEERSEVDSQQASGAPQLAAAAVDDGGLAARLARGGNLASALQRNVSSTFAGTRGKVLEAAQIGGSIGSNIAMGAMGAKRADFVRHHITSTSQ
jgi:hypothetical protein